MRVIGSCKLIKLYLHFLSYWMGYDRGDSFPLDFLNQMENPFGSKSKGKLSPRLYPVQCERKLKYSFLSACEMFAYIWWGVAVKGSFCGNSLITYSKFWLPGENFSLCFFFSVFPHSNFDVPWRTFCRNYQLNWS